MRNPPASSQTVRLAGAALCAVAALLLAAAPASAQNVLDNIATMTASAPASGMFATGRAGTTGLAAGAPVTAELVRNEVKVLAAGPTADQLLAAVLSGGPATGVAAALTDAGAQEDRVTPLMVRLSALAYSPGMPSLKAAMQAYNALVKGAPASFVNKPPAQLLSIRTALIAIWSAR